MKAEKLDKAIRLAKKAGFVLVGTADDKGMPHITAAGRVDTTGDSAVVITEWFCPGTVANLQKNKSVSVVIWTKQMKQGYQLLGQLEAVQDIGILDGFSARHEGRPPLPQVEKQLWIKVEKVLEFRLGPHSDTED
jgi:general stress protein 26